MVIAQRELRPRLARWQEAGLLDAEQAERIAAFEAGDTQPGPDTPRTPGERSRRTLVAEAIGYVGAALALAALVLIVGDVWDTLTDVGRLTLVLVLTVILGGSTSALRSTTSAALARLASLLSLGAVVGVAWAASIATYDLLGTSGEDAALLSGLAASAAALAGYLARPRPLPQVTLLVAVASTVEIAVVRGTLPTDAFWYALPVVAVGAVWVLLGAGGWLRPPAVATTAGAALVVAALQCGSFGDHRTLALALGLVVASAAVALAVVAGGTHNLAVGSVGLFVLLPQLVVHLFGDAIGVPATLLVVGLLLVLLAVGLGRVRREVGAGGAS